jgi:hypothetical protein
MNPLFDNNYFLLAASDDGAPTILKTCPDYNAAFDAYEKAFEDPKNAGLVLCVAVAQVRRRRLED